MRFSLKALDNLRIKRYLMNYQPEKALEIGENPVDYIIKCLYDNNHDVRINAARALGKVKSEKAIMALIDVLNREGPSIDVIQALGEIGDRRAIEPLKKFLKHYNPMIREKTVEALKKLGEKVFLDNTSKDMREKKKDRHNRPYRPEIPLQNTEKNTLTYENQTNIDDIVGSTEENEDIEKLLAKLQNKLDSDTDPNRNGAKEAVVLAKSATEFIEQLGKSSYRETRVYAQKACCEIGEKTVNILLSGLYDKDENVRDAAIEGLRKIALILQKAKKATNIK